MNPTLSDLVGGIESVTLSDEEARRRGTQKSVLERRAPPTFDVLVELQERHRLVVHHDVAASVDALLRGRELPPEVRYRDVDGTVHVEKSYSAPTRHPDEPSPAWPSKPAQPAEPATALRTLRIYPYGIGQNRLRQAAANLQVPLVIADDLRGADAVMTLKNYYRKHPQPITEAERRSIPVYVLRSNTVAQMESSLADIFRLPTESVDPMTQALAEAQDAIRRILEGAPMVELGPQMPDARRQQHQMARAANLISHSYGNEPYRRVRIYRE
jgi:hypothetical protein